MNGLAEQLPASLAAVVEASASSVIRVDGHRRLWSSGVVGPLYGIDDLQRVMVLSGKPDLELDLWRGKGRHALSARPERPRRAA
jgi:hypothetical protein